MEKVTSPKNNIVGISPKEYIQELWHGTQVKANMLNYLAYPLSDFPTWCTVKLQVTQQLSLDLKMLTNKQTYIYIYTRTLTQLQ